MGVLEPLYLLEHMGPVPTHRLSVTLGLAMVFAREWRLGYQGSQSSLIGRIVERLQLLVGDFELGMKLPQAIRDLPQLPLHRRPRRRA